MDAVAELGRNPVSKHQIQPEYGDEQDGTAEPVSRRQIFRCEQRGQGSVHFSCSADHVQDWQPCPVDPYPSLLHIYVMAIHTKTSYATLYKECRRPIVYNIASTFNMPTSYQ